MKGFLCFNITQNVKRTQEELGSVSVTALPAAGPLRNSSGPVALRTQRDLMEPCIHQQPSGKWKSALELGMAPVPWCRQCPSMASSMPPLRVLWQQAQGRIRAKRAFSIQGVQDNLQFYSFDFRKQFNSMLQL